VGSVALSGPGTQPEFLYSGVHPVLFPQTNQEFLLPHNQEPVYDFLSLLMQSSKAMNLWTWDPEELPVIYETRRSGPVCWSAHRLQPQYVMSDRNNPMGWPHRRTKG